MGKKRDLRMISKCMRLTTALVVVAFLSGAGALGAERKGGERSEVGGDLIVPGKGVVKLRPAGLTGTAGRGKVSAGLLSEFAKAGITGVVEACGEGALPELSRIFAVTFDQARPSEAVLRQLRKMEGVEYAEPRYYCRVADVPNDPGLTQQNGAFTRMNIFNAWSLGKGSSSVVIATVDGGTMWSHEDLLPNLWVNTAEDRNGNGRYDSAAAPAGDRDGIDQDGNGKVDDVIGWNFPLNTGNPAGLAGQFVNPAHGTATASHSSAGTNNGIGMAGTSWNCRLMPINASATADNLIEYGPEAIEYAARMGAKVINCSFGRSGSFSRFEQEIVDAAVARGALIVAAAGNSNTNADYAPHYPSHYRGVLAVGATGSADDVRAPFSNYGVNVPVFAPGVDIWSAKSDGTYWNGGSGTSYSSPLVAGVAGLIRAAHPSWGPAAVAAQLRMTADSIDAVPGNTAVIGRVGRGRVNAARAMSESHAGIDVVSFLMTTPRGSGVFVAGDSVVVTVTVRNVLFNAVSGATFRLESLDPELSFLQGGAFLPSLSPGGEAQLTQFVGRVQPLASPKRIVLKLSWVMNGNERDARAFRATLFPSIPRWLEQTTPTSLSLYSVKAVDRSVVWGSGGDGAASNPVVVRTTDGGGVWVEVTGDLPAEDFFCIEAIDAVRAWVGSATGRIYRTTDGGLHWMQQTYGGPQSPFIDAIRFFDAQRGIALGDPPAGSSRFVVLQTSDGGTTWTHLANEPGNLAGEAGWNNAFWWSDPRHGWIGTNKSRIWRTTDGGATWSSSPSGGGNSYGISFRDSVNGFAGHDGGVVARTTDGGATWGVVPFPFGTNVTGVAYPAGGREGWIAVGTDMARTTNAGASWESEVASPIVGSISHISFADTTRGWAVTSAGEILRYAVEEIRTDPPVPLSYQLEQNYPNPFNGPTRIGFSLPESARVEIVLYDLLGRRTATIVDRFYGVGRWEVPFSGAGKASGVYFYRIRAYGSDAGLLFTAVKRMVMIR